MEKEKPVRKDELNFFGTVGRLYIKILIKNDESIGLLGTSKNRRIGHAIEHD